MSYSLVGLPIWTSSPVLETLRTLDIASLECWVRLQVTRFPSLFPIAHEAQLAALQLERRVEVAVRRRIDPPRDCQQIVLVHSRCHPRLGLSVLRVVAIPALIQ